MFNFIKKSKECPKDSIHAWKDSSGYLHDTVEKRDGSNRRILKGRRMDALSKYLGRPGFKYVYQGPGDYRISDLPARVYSGMRPDEVAKQVIDNWDEIKKLVESIREDK